MKGNLPTYCVNPGRFLGKKSQETNGMTEAPFGKMVKVSSGFMPVESRFSPTPLAQITQISLISSAATPNPSTVNKSVTLNLVKMEDFRP